MIRAIRRIQYEFGFCAERADGAHRDYANFHGGAAHFVDFLTAFRNEGGLIGAEAEAFAEVVGDDIFLH